MIGKNTPCWCGSGKKYKHCHEEWDNTINVLKLQGKIVPSHNLIKSEEDIKWIKKAAKINNAVLDLVGEKICAGMTTEDIDKLVYDYTTSHGGIPACLGYEGFPKSVCTSINNEICHGIPSEKVVLKDGDIINVDCTTIVHKHFADAVDTFTGFDELDLINVIPYLAAKYDSILYLSSSVTNRSKAIISAISPSSHFPILVVPATLTPT